MKILVTGATGFTGGHLCERLVKSGSQVRAFVRDPNRCDTLRRQGIEIVVGELRDRSSIDRAMQGIDVVYHVGALFRQENVSRKDMWNVNVQGTRHLVEAAEKNGVKRFVYCSTAGVHGDVKNPPGDEETPYGPGDYYQESKVEAEKLVLHHAQKREMPIVVFRPGAIYGPRDLRFLKLFRAIKHQRFVMLGSGNVLYQLIYIDNLVDGILQCGTKEEAIGQVYILTGQEPITLNHFVRTIAEVFGVSPPRFHFPVMPVYLAGWACELLFKPFGINPPLYRRRVDFFRKTRSFSITKAKNELNFNPTVDLATGIKLTAEWYRQEGLL